ncbi:MAG: SDR family oxidoreductase [Alphaproteobacteria bacterium]|jgi:NAD(P)-dependent dehydrogenase (short-subunit alcohol dehydrogenase family)
MDLHLAGKTALVTGASKGIGLACAKELAAEGVHLHLASRTEADLQKAADEIRSAHQVNVTVHAIDIAAKGNSEKLAAACNDLDILVNNAGAIPPGTLMDIDEDRWRDAWNLKVFGYINLTRAVYPMLKAKGGGVIVNVLGMAGFSPNFAYVAGATGNAGLMHFTRAMGGRSVDDGIRVVGCNPGLVATERMITMCKGMAKDEFGDENRWQEMVQKDPPPGKPEEIADLVAYLASDRASHLSGTVINIDGGKSSR